MLWARLNLWAKFYPGPWGNILWKNPAPLKRAPFLWNLGSRVCLQQGTHLSGTQHAHPPLPFIERGTGADVEHPTKGKLSKSFNLSRKLKSRLQLGRGCWKGMQSQPAPPPLVQPVPLLTSTPRDFSHIISSSLAGDANTRRLQNQISVFRQGFTKNTPSPNPLVRIPDPSIQCSYPKLQAALPSPLSLLT